MKVVTFYSFRGGVGRSVAVANVSHLMVESRERRVLMVDFDLEAPGLSFMPYFRTDGEQRVPGIFEFMLHFQRGRQPNIADYISSPSKYGGYLGLIRAGDLQSGKYAITDVSIPGLLKPRKDNSPNFVDYFRAQVESLKYHYVLLDSRTGLTETSGLCTVALADLVVVLSGLNHQNQQGTKWVLENLRQKPGGMERAIVVFSHIPNSEEELKAKRIAEAQDFLGLGRTQPVSLFYHPRLSLEEELFVEKWKQAPLAASYRLLTEEIWGRNEEDLSQLIKRIDNYHWRIPDEELVASKRSADRLQRLEKLRDKALGLYPSNSNIQRAIGRQYYELNEFSKAAEYFERAFQASKTFSDDQSRYFEVLVKLNDRVRLQAAFNRLVTTLRHLEFPERRKAIRVLSRVPYETDWINDFAAGSRAKKDRHQTEIQLLFHNGLAQLISELLNSDMSVDERTSLLLARANELEAIYEITGDIKIAKEITSLYQECLNSRPNDSNIRNSLGVINWKSGSLDQAALLFDEILQKEPRNSTVLSNDAELSIIRNEYERFTRRASAIRSINPGNPGYDDKNLTILAFLEWLISRSKSIKDVLAAFDRFTPDSGIFWDFSDIEPVITKLSEPKKSLAQLLIRFFKQDITREELDVQVSKLRAEPKLF